MRPKDTNELTVLLSWTDVQLGHRARGAALTGRADGLEVLGEAVAEFGMVLGILRETDSERRPIPGALSVSVRGRTMPWYWGAVCGSHARGARKTLRVRV
jgi:hypothetical protein